MRIMKFLKKMQGMDTPGNVSLLFPSGQRCFRRKAGDRDFIRKKLFPGVPDGTGPEASPARTGILY